MKALLFSVFANVITPSHLACDFIQGIKRSGTRTNEDQVTRDRGDGKDSTTGIELPEDVRCVSRGLVSVLFRLSTTRGRQRRQQTNRNKRPRQSHKNRIRNASSTRWKGFVIHFFLFILASRAFISASDGTSSTFRNSSVTPASTL